MAIRNLFEICAAALTMAAIVSAHGGGAAHQKPLTVDPKADWATRHMAEEHHISVFDSASFFSLHDYDDNGLWDPSEILKTYGMTDPSAKDVPQSKRDQILRDVLGMMDENHNGMIEREEWERFSEGKGKGGRGVKGTLPDFGTGPGHHWDMEMEYEIHHWERFHDENTKEEDLIHPEDIEHFKLHDQMEDEADRVAELDKMAIVEQNIPKKFRRDI